MLGFMILTVSNIERSLTFYDAALKPLNIRFFLPYKGKNGHPDQWGFGDGRQAFFWLQRGKPDPAVIHWGFMAESNEKVDEFYKSAIAPAPRTISHRGCESNTIRATTLRMCSIRTATHSRSCIRSEVSLAQYNNTASR
jgi:hypothetical protein